MADILYGDQQIEQQALLKNLADSVQGYVANQPWSTKRKEKFMSAYSDIMNHGILGASNSTGQWTLNIGGDTIDLSSKNKKDQEMYGEAAYFIQQQMSKMPNPKTVEEEKKKELPTFDNNYFYNDFTKHLYKGFGGREISTQEWMELDPRGENGIRSRTNRAKKLADTLDSYAKSLDASKINFEDSPFTDINDFRAKVSNAVSVLRSGQDATEALNAIGLKASDWLNDGSGDQYSVDEKTGEPITYGQRAELLAQQKQEKAQEEALKRQQAANAKRGILSQVGGIHAVEARTSPEAYQEYLTRFGTGQAGFNAVNNRINKLINIGYSGKMSSADKKELGNLLYYIRQNNPNYQGLGNGTNTNITDQEWADLRLHTKSLSSVNRGNFIRLPWQTQDGRYTYADNKGNLYFLKPNNGQKFSAPSIRSKGYYDYKNNFLKGTSLMNKQQRDAYLKSKKDGLTSAEWEELASIGFDIASIVDPEMISSAGLALAGSGLRHHAAVSQPGGMSTSDKWWQAADYGLSLLGSIPGLGDAALLARATNNLKKAIVPLGLVMAGANVPQAAKAAYNKVVNGQDLTIQDWRAIGGVLTAAIGMGRGRQMAKRAEALQRIGGTTSKSIKKGVIKTTEGEIKVSESKAKQLKEKFGKSNGETRTKALREDAEIQKAAKEQGIDLSKAEVQGYSRFKFSPISTSKTSSTSSGNRIATLRAMSEFNKNHGWLARKGLAEQDWVFRKTGGYETPKNNGLWKTVKDWWNNDKWSDFGNEHRTPKQITTETNVKISKEVEKPNRETNVKISKEVEKPNRETQFNRATINRYKDIMSGKFSKNKVQEGTLEINGVTFKVTKNKNGKYTITDNGPVSSEHPRRLHSNLSEGTLKKKMAEIVQKSRTQSDSNGKITKKSTKEIGEILQKLKRKGWLKQGGKITDTQIDNFLNQYK